MSSTEFCVVCSGFDIIAVCASEAAAVALISERWPTQSFVVQHWPRRTGGPQAWLVPSRESGAVLYASDDYEAAKAAHAAYVSVGIAFDSVDYWCADIGRVIETAAAIHDQIEKANAAALDGLAEDKKESDAARVAHVRYCG